MTDCTNDAIRDRLPELANGMLPADEMVAARAHLAICAACAAELAVLETSRLVLRATACKVDLAAVTRAVTTSKPSLRVERGGATAPTLVRKPVWRSRQFLAAAASLLIVATLSIPALSRRGEPTQAAVPDTVIAATINTPLTAPVPAGFANSEGLSDLSSSDLSTLLAELERVEANVTSEPASMQAPLIDAPEDY